MKKAIYTALRDRLDTNISALEWIDLFNNQFENMEKEYPFGFPCAFIEFLPIEWVNTGNNVQKGDAVIRIHIGQTTIASSFKGSPDSSVALGVLDFLETVHKVLQGFGGPGFSALDRILETTDTNHDSIIVHTLDYRTRITDASGAGSDQYEEKNPALKIEGDIV